MNEFLERYLTGERDLVWYLQHEIPELSKPRDLAFVFTLRDWLMSNLCFGDLALVIPHEDRDGNRMLKVLLRREGIMWCAGAAKLFALLLRAFHVPATTYMYGYQGIASLSHMTTVFSLTVRDEQGFAIPRFYLGDAYLGFHYEDPVSHQILELPELLRRTRDGRYKEVERIDTIVERPYVTLPGSDPAFFADFFDDRGIPEVEKNDKTWVYPGATFTVDKLFKSTSPMRKLADEKRGNQPLDHFLLDLMFIEPSWGRMTLALDQNPAGYVDWMLMRELVDVMAGSCVRE